MNDLQDDKRLRPEPDARSPSPGFIYRTVAVYGIGMLFLLLIALVWYSSRVLLLILASILVAVLLHEVSLRVGRWLRIRRGTALVLVLFLAFTLFGLGGWAIAPRVIEQANQMMVDVPDAIERLQSQLKDYPLVRDLLRHLPAPEELLKDASAMLTRVGLVFSGILGAIGNLVLILFVGIYFAAQPHVYVNGIIKLLPKGRRERGREVMSELGDTLGLWLMGKALAMLIVGVVTATGLSLLGVPLALVLGLVAGLLDFIPYLGPIMAAVPAVLIAFTQSPVLALYVILLFVFLQILEGYLVTPLIERKAVSLPPALTITMQVLLGLPFGLVGVALASPLTATIAVLVAMLYVQDVLGDRVTLPGDRS